MICKFLSGIFYILSLLFGDFVEYIDCYLYIRYKTVQDIVNLVFLSIVIHPTILS